MSFNKNWRRTKEFLSNLDLFGQKIDLTYRKEVYFRTYYGAIFTIMIFIFLTFQIYSGYKDLTTRLSPIINMMEIEEEGTTKLDLLNQNITITLGFVSENRSEYLYDPSYFNVDASLISKTRNESYDDTSSFNMNLSHCNRSDFKGFQNIYDNFNLHNAICVKAPKEKNKIEIYSNPDDFTESYLKITLKLCVNNTKITCKPLEDITHRLLYLNLYVYIKHDYFDGGDINEPIKHRLSFEKWSFDDLDVRRKDSIYVSQMILKDYNSLYFSLTEPKESRFIFYSEKDIIRNFRFGTIDLINNKFMELYVKAHSIPIKITRKYTTFVDLLANIGGLFNVFFLLGTVIFGYINRTLLDCKMINDHFNIVDTKDVELQTKHGSDNEIHLFNKSNDFNFKNSKSKDNSYFRNSPSFDDLKYSSKVSNNTSMFQSLQQDKDLLNINKENQTIKEETENESGLDKPILNESCLTDTFIKYEYPFDSNKPIKDDYSVKKVTFKSNSNSLYDNDEHINQPNASINSFKPFRIIKTDELQDNKELLLDNHRPSHKNFKFRYTIIDIIFSFFCIQKKIVSKKNEIYQNCKKIIDNYLDIKNLISLIQEFKVVRNVLFDDIQLSLINYYKKPILKINNANQNKTLLVYRKSQINEQTHDLIDFCDVKDNLKLINERYKSKKEEIDRKILEITKINNNNKK